MFWAVFDNIEIVEDFKFDYLFLSGKPNFPIESFYLDNSIFKEK